MISTSSRRRALHVTITCSLVLASPSRVIGAQMPVAAHSDIRWDPYDFVSAKGDSIKGWLGHLRVLEVRSNPQSRTIELAFVKLPSTSTKPGAPIIYLDGGPGNSGISSSRNDRFKVMNTLRQVSDVILMDHRGVGLTGPDMTCPGNFALPLNSPLDEKEVIAAARRISRACVTTMREKGIDLRGYTVTEAADDVDDLRRALGVPKINLLALSYGTTQGLTVIRRHGANVNRAILAGIEGPDDAIKLPSRVDSMFFKVDSIWKSDAVLARDVPSLVGAYRTARDILRTHPVTVRILPYRAADSLTITVGPLDLEVTTYAIMAADGLPRLPAFLSRAALGDFTAIAAIAARQRTNELDAMSFYVDCATGGTPERRRRVARETPSSMLGRAANLIFYPQLCDAWGSPDVGAIYRSPVHSDVPTLFISGTLDARTPPIQAELVRKSFRTSAHHIVRGAVHSSPLFLASPLTLPTMLEFMSTGRMRSATVDGGFQFRPASTPPLS